MKNTTRNFRKILKISQIFTKARIIDHTISSDKIVDTLSNRLVLLQLLHYI